VDSGTTTYTIPGDGASAQPRAAGSPRVYWQTHQTNAAGRLLYDQVAKHLGFIVYSQEL